MLLGEKEMNAFDWECIKAKVREDIMLSLQSFDPHTVSDRVLRRILAEFADRKFTFDAARKASRACGSLYKWVQSYTRYVQVQMCVAHTSMVRGTGARGYCQLPTVHAPGEC